MTIALSTDHAGFEQLKQLQKFLEELGHDCRYLGPKSFSAHDDFPRFIMPAARAVAEGQCDRGIIMGGSGQGEAMVANRLPGVRCAVYYGPAVPRRAIDAEGHQSHDPFSIVRLSRAHNDANMLSLAARFLSLEEMKGAVRVWLETEFDDKTDHARRIREMDEEL